MDAAGFRDKEDFVLDRVRRMARPGTAWWSASNPIGMRASICGAPETTRWFCAGW